MTAALISGVLEFARKWDKNVDELIKVAIRARPVCDKDEPALWKIQNNLIESISDRKQSIHQFDNVYDEKTTNEDLYHSIAAPIVKGVLEGFHGTICAYGQTGSGKTHTMTGSPSDPGLIRMALREIFDKANNSTERAYLVRTSYLEIYNEELHDLFNKDAKCLRIREENGFVRVQNLSQELPQSMEEVLESLSKAEVIRRFAETNMNARSSRSHTIFQILVDSRPNEGEGNESQASMVSELNLVDLAGSERVGQTGATGGLLREGCFINRSLSSLCLVISKLSAGKQGLHIPYRDSKLTRILQNALGGNSRTVIVCTINMSVADQTDGTLNFARQAMRISTKPVKNEFMSKEAYISRLLKEMDELKKEMEKYKSADVSKMTRQAGMLRKWIESSNVNMLAKSENKGDVAQRRYSWAPGTGALQRPFGPATRFLRDRRMSPLLELTNLEDTFSGNKSFTPVKENNPPNELETSLLNFDVADEEMRCVTERNNELSSENTSLKVRLSCKAKDQKMLMEQIDSLRNKVLDLEMFKEQTVNDEFNRLGALCDQEELKCENEKLRQELDARAAEVEMFEERYLAMQARLKEQSRIAEMQRPPDVRATFTVDAASETSRDIRNAATNTEDAEDAKLEIVSQMEELQAENNELIGELQGLQEVKKALDATEKLTRKNEAFTVEKVNDFSRLIDRLVLEIEEERRRKEEVEEEVEEERRERRIMEVTLEKLRLADEERRRQEMLAESERRFVEARNKIDELQMETDLMDLTQENEQLKEQVACLVTEVENMKSEQEMDVLRMTLQEKIKEVEARGEESEASAKDCQDIETLRTQLEAERWKNKDLTKTIKMVGVMIHDQDKEEKQERHRNEELRTKDEQLEELREEMQLLRSELDVERDERKKEVEEKVAETNSLRKAVEVIEKQLEVERNSRTVDSFEDGEYKRTREDLRNEIEVLRTKVKEEIEEKIVIENTRNNEVSELARKMEESELELERGRIKIQDLEVELDQERRRIRDFEEGKDELENAKKTIRDLEVELEQERRRILEFDEVIDQLETARNRINDLEEELVHDRLKIQDLEVELDRERRKIQESDEEKNELEMARNRINSLEVELEQERRRRLESGEVIDQLETARNRINDLEEELVHDRLKIQDLEVELDRGRRKIQESDEEKNELEMARNRINSLEVELEQERRGILESGEVIDQLETARNRINDLEEELVHDRLKIQDLEVELDRERRKTQDLEVERLTMGEVVGELEEVRRKMQGLEDRNKLLSDSVRDLDVARKRSEEMEKANLAMADTIRKLGMEKDHLVTSAAKELEKANKRSQEMELENVQANEAVSELRECQSAMEQLRQSLSDPPRCETSNRKNYEIVEAVEQELSHLRRKTEQREIEVEELMDEVRRFLSRVGIKLGDTPAGERLNHLRRALDRASETMKSLERPHVVTKDCELKKQLDESSNELSKKTEEISQLLRDIEYLEEREMEMRADLVDIRQTHSLCDMRWTNLRWLLSLDNKIVETDDVDRAVEAMAQERNLCLPLYSFIVDCVETEYASGKLSELDQLIDDYLSSDDEFMGDRRKAFHEVSERLRNAYAKKLAAYKAVCVKPATPLTSSVTLGVQTDADERLAVLQRSLSRLQLEDGIRREEMQRKEEWAKNKIEEQQKELTELHSQLRRHINAGGRIRESVQEQSFVVPSEKQANCWRLDPRVPSQTASYLFRRPSTSNVVSPATPPPPSFTPTTAVTPPNASVHGVTPSETKTKEQQEFDDAIDEAEHQCRQQ